MNSVNPHHVAHCMCSLNHMIRYIVTTVCARMILLTSIFQICNMLSILQAPEPWEARKGWAEAKQKFESVNGGNTVDQGFHITMAHLLLAPCCAAVRTPSTTMPALIFLVLNIILMKVIKIFECGRLQDLQKQCLFRWRLDPLVQALLNVHILFIMLTSDVTPYDPINPFDPNFVLPWLNLDLVISSGLSQWEGFDRTYLLMFFFPLISSVPSKEVGSLINPYQSNH